MLPTSFEYQKAGSIDEAIALLSNNGGDAKILAGGHSLIPAMKLRLDQPAKLIDIGGIAALKYIRKEGNELVIGAATTHHEIAASPLATKIPMFPQAAEMIGDIQVRNRGTIGGSLAHADPAADWPAVVLAADSQIVAQGPKGQRTIAASDFFTGFFETALEEDEIITGIRVAVPVGKANSAYRKFEQPASRFAIVGCAAALAWDGSRVMRATIAFTGLSDKAFRDKAVEDALAGKELTNATITTAAKLAAEGVFIQSDHFASDTYRKHLANVFARKALLAAANFA